MPNLNDLTALALPSEGLLVADETESGLHLHLQGQPLIQLRLSREPELKVLVEEQFDHPVEHSIRLACYWLFARDPACQRVTWQLDEIPTQALLSGLLIPGEVVGQYHCLRPCSGNCLSHGWARGRRLAIHTIRSSAIANAIRCVH